MRKLRKAAVVAVMVGSVGMLGAGTAAAGDGPSGKINIFNPQELDCVYTDNTAGAPINTATTATGSATSTQVLGNTCPQTGPSFGDDD